MNLKNSFTKKGSRYLLAMIFGFSLLSNNYAFSEDVNKQKPKLTQSEKEATSKVVKLQVLVESYSIDYKDKYPLNITNLKKVKEIYGNNKFVRSSNGEVVSNKQILDNAVDYSEYEKSTNKKDFKNRVIYKPLNITSDNLFASDYQIYYSDDEGNLAKMKGVIYYESDIDNDPKTSSVPDNFSDPDGYVDSMYHYKYFGLTTSHGKPTNDEIITKCLEKIKEGKKTQQIYSNLILVYHENKENEKAKQTAFKFLKDFPDSAEANHLVSLEYRGEEAIFYAEKAVALNPQNPSYRADLANSYSSIKKYNEALKEYEKIKIEMPYALSDVEKRIEEIKNKAKI